MLNIDDKYISGDHYVICDYSGFKIRRSQAVYTWDGYLVDRRFADVARHPQDFVRGRKDTIAVPDGRSEQEDSFLVTDVSKDDL